MIRPLVSFYVITFNQSLFIEQAMHSALAQDYFPLEVIISDDCSTDDTWEKIQSIASQYSGQHSLVIRRNQKNLGVSNHINKIWDCSNGEWIIASAGDDFSNPKRVSKIISIVMQNPKLKLVQSWLNEISERGSLINVNKLGDNYPHEDGSLKIADIQDRCIGNTISYHGAAMAYSKEVIKQFPKLPAKVIFEDNIVNFRAELLGEVGWLRSTLVNHRNHSGQLTQTSNNLDFNISEERKKKCMESDIISLKQNIEDLKIMWRKQAITDYVYSNINLKLKNNLRNTIELQKIFIKHWPTTFFHYLRLKYYRINTSKELFFRSLCPKLIYAQFLYPLRKSMLYWSVQLRRGNTSTSDK